VATLGGRSARFRRPPRGSRYVDSDSRCVEISNGCQGVLNARCAGVPSAGTGHASSARTASPPIRGRRAMQLRQGAIPISCDKSRVLARQNAVSISQSFGDPEILGDLHRRPSQIKGAPNHRAVRGGQLRQRVSDQQSVDGGVHLVGTAGSGKSGESSELASLRNDERRLWSMIMLRTTVNSHARADRSPSSVTSGCCHARSSVSCTRSSARTRSPVSRKA
jgi:hypothetical protein